ncbi:MAG: class E sortase, partial [Acidimicrobiales bacterium]
GTGILTAQAQGDLENDFESLLLEAEELEATLASTAASAAEGAPEVSLEPAIPQPSQADTQAEKEAAALAAAEAAEAAKQAQAEADALAAAELELKSNLIWRPTGEPVAQLFMPTIDQEWTMVEGVSTEPLRKGPGRYPGTSFPGMPGNVGIAGHRTTWGAPFSRIDELAPGDIITLKTLQGVFEYRVVEQENGLGYFIVSPDRVDVLDQDFVEYPNRITLTACHPKFSARQRIIVVAELIGEPAEYIPPPEALAPRGAPQLVSENFGTDAAGDLPGDVDIIAAEAAADAADAAEAADAADETEGEDEPVTDEPSDPVAVAAQFTDGDGVSGDGPTQAQSAALQGSRETEGFGQGLSGDRSAIFPAVMWALAATAIAFAAGFIGRRWKKWPTYALSFAPFAIVVFFSFVQIDQALPSY